MPDPEKKGGTILTTVSLIVSHPYQKSFLRVFYLRHAFQNTVIVFETGFRDFSFLNRFPDSAARIGIVFAIAIFTQT